MTVNLDRACPHEDFAASVEVNRLPLVDGGPIVGFSASLRIRCTQCDESFRFRGVPAGLSPRHPTCSVDESELRIPIRPASADPDFGMGIPGFAINYRPAATPDDERNYASDDTRD